MKIRLLAGTMLLLILALVAACAPAPADTPTAPIDPASPGSASALGPSPSPFPLTLTDEAVVEPPPALYLAMQRSVDGAGNWRIGVPLHAQSPLPRRVDLMDPARGFRIGLMRRHADFVWYLTCPATMLGKQSLAVHKSDRNGQGYWPREAAEFLTPKDFSLQAPSS